MGNTLPVPNERMQRLIDSAQLKKSDQKVCCCVRRSPQLKSPPCAEPARLAAPSLLQVLWKAFKTVDKDNSGSIDADEFMYFLKEPKSEFTTGLFDLIDTDSSHELDFFEFASALVTFACFTEEEMLKYCFYIFDKDKNGFIEMDELDYLLECLHQGGYATSIAAVTEQLDVDRDGRISMEEFASINKSFPFLLFPAFRFQQACMRETFNEAWWMKKRESLQNARDAKNARTNVIRDKHKGQEIEVRYNKMGEEVGLLGVWRHKSWYKLRARFNTWANIKEGKVELAEGANFVPVPSALVEKVLHAHGKPPLLSDDDETPEAAARRALQAGNSERRSRQRERSMKRKKNRVEAAKLDTPAPALAPAPAPAAAVIAPAPGHSRRWSQEANIFPAAC